MRNARSFAYDSGSQWHRQGLPEHPQRRAASFPECCCLLGDITSLTRIPGLGKKTAERIVVELKDNESSSRQAMRKSRLRWGRKHKSWTMR